MAEARPPAELVLTGAVIHTMDTQNPRPEALAIGGGSILAAGAHQHVHALAGADTVVLDLDGRFVLPGLADAHIHLAKFAQALAKVDCETPSLEICLDRVRAKAESLPADAWILGHGWDQNRWSRFGNADELDRVTPRNPAFLTAKSLHAAWANSRALARAGLDASTPDPPGGRLGRTADGRLNGILYESAMALVRDHIPRPDRHSLAGLILAALPRLQRVGLTCVHDFDGADCFAALQILRQRDQLGLRVVKNLPIDALPHARAVGLRSGFGDAWLWIGSIKVFADGALGPRTAWMLEPYEQEPENRGISLLDEETLLEHALEAGEAGFGLAVHAIGDAANHAVLNAVEALRKEEARRGWPSRRHRIEHLQLLHPDDLARPAELGLIASMQPIHATSDMPVATRYWGDRARFSYAWKSQQQAGATLAFGSDAPVENPNPFWGLHAAVTRTVRGQAGTPASPWIPQERLQLQLALEAYTRGAAFAGGVETRLGMLRSGYAADLVVLASDPFSLDADALAELLPIGTMVGGRWVHREF